MCPVVSTIAVVVVAASGTTIMVGQRGRRRQVGMQEGMRTIIIHRVIAGVITIICCIHITGHLFF